MDPSISIQHTRRKNTLSAVKCSDKRAKSRTPVAQDVSKKRNGSNGVVLLLELNQDISLSHPACSSSWFWPYLLLCWLHEWQGWEEMLAVPMQVCTVFQAHASLQVCFLCCNVEIISNTFPNDDCISSALTYVLLLRLASCSCLRQEKLNQKTHRQQKTVSWELGTAVFHGSGLLYMGSCLFLGLLLIAHART